MRISFGVDDVGGEVEDEDPYDPARCDQLLRILSAAVLDAYEASTKIGVDEDAK